MPYIALFKLAGSVDERRKSRVSLRGLIREALFSGTGALSEAVVLVGIAEPTELDLYREGEDFSPPYDLAIEAEFESNEEFREWLDGSELCDRSAFHDAYQTERVIKKGTLPVETGELPGVRMLHPLRFHADLPRSALLRSWREIHGELAVRAHAGASYYAQHLSLQRLTDRAPGFGGFSSFQFPSHEALVGGYFADAAARVAVRHDIRHFIDGIPPRMFATAYRYTNP